MNRVPHDERRRQLIEAAVRVISREGTARATTRRIAAEADAPLASLHYSFRDKDELFHAVIEHCQMLTVERFREHTSPGGGLRDAVHALIEQFFDWTQAEPEFQVAQFELMFWARRTPSAREFPSQIYRDYHVLISEMLSTAAGDDHDPHDISRLATHITAVVDGMMLQIIALGEAGPSSEDVEVITATAMASIASPVT
jgi:AcrR family transcriptional regulator